MNESSGGSKITTKNEKTISKRWKIYSCAYEVFSFDGEMEFTVPKGQDGVSEIKWSGHTKDAATISVEENVLALDGNVIDAEKYKTIVWKDGGKKVAEFEIRPYTENIEPDDRLTFNIYIK